MRKVLSVLLGVTCLCVPDVALAMTPVPSTGVAIRPAIASLTTQPGQSAVTLTETLENDTQRPVTIVPVASDFGTTGVNGAIELKKLPDALHGLAGNLQFTPASLTLAKGQSRSVTVQVRDVSALSPGGHFAAIRYRVLAGPTTGDKSTVGITSELLSFVFLTTTGRASYGVSLKTSLPHIAFWQPPSEADLLFTNTANTQTAPRGILNISGPGHTQVVNSIINPDSALVLPGSTRLFQMQLRRIKTAIWPGSYTADIYYRATSAVSYEHEQQHFFLVGWPVLAVLFGVFLLLIAAVWTLRKRRHNISSQINVSPNAGPTTAKRRSIPVKHL